MNAAETHETIHWESGMRYQLSHTTTPWVPVLPALRRVVVLGLAGTRLTSAVRAQRGKDSLAQDLVFADAGLVMVGGTRLDRIVPPGIPCAARAPWMACESVDTSHIVTI